jgi:hypothetical protein
MNKKYLFGGAIVLLIAYLYYENKKAIDNAAPQDSGSGGGGVGGGGSAAPMNQSLMTNMTTPAPKIDAGGLGAPQTNLVTMVTDTPNTGIGVGGGNTGGGIGNAPIYSTNNPSPINSTYPTQIPLRNNIR